MKRLPFKRIELGEASYKGVNRKAKEVFSYRIFNGKIVGNS
jgi:hypothetical protein